MKYILILTFITLSISACKKSNGSTNPGDPNASNAGNLLVKRVDSTFVPGSSLFLSTTFFTYDANNWLSRREVLDTPDVFSNPFQTNYRRDSKGRTISIEVLPNHPPTDTLTTLVNYISGSGKISYLYQYNSANPNVDSIVYDYTGSSITGIRHFLKSPYSANTSGSAYTYDGTGALASSTSDVQDPPNTMEYMFTHDGKINPLILGPEELENSPYFFSADNIMQQAATSSYDSTPIITTDTYTYRSDGRPLYRVRRNSFFPDVTTSTFYYKD